MSLITYQSKLNHVEANSIPRLSVSKDAIIISNLINLAEQLKVY